MSHLLAKCDFGTAPAAAAVGAFGPVLFVLKTTTTKTATRC